MSAPRIVLSLGNSILGYAIGFNFNISIEVQPITIIGSLAPIALEPTFYNVVTGTMQVVRLASPKARADALTNAKNDMAQAGKAETFTALNWDGTNTNIVSNPASIVTKAGETITSKSNIWTHLDPRLVLISRLFNMNVSVKVPVVNAETVYTKSPSPITFDSTSEKITVDDAKLWDSKSWLSIQGCRLTGRSANLSTAQLVNEPVTFQGLLAVSYDGSGNALISQDDPYTEGLIKDPVAGP
jgi:hypothetical protein